MYLPSFSCGKCVLAHTHDVAHGGINAAPQAPISTQTVWGLCQEGSSGKTLPESVQPQ